MAEDVSVDGRRRLLYVGCYTETGNPGIRVFDASRRDGTLAPVGEHAGVVDASYLAVHPRGDVLYAVSERTAPDSGEVVALRIDATDGALVEVGRAPSHGAAPCHLAVSADGRHLYVANYLDGSCSAYALRPDGGLDRLLSRHQHTGGGPRTDRQEGPHAHGVLPRPAGTLLVTDLGTDQLLRYRHTDAGSGALELDDALAMPAGTGPRHAVTHPHRSDLVLVVGELDQTLAVVEDRHDEPLRLVARARTVPADPADATTVTSAAVVVDAHRGLAYVSNRGADTIAVLELPADGGPPVLRATVAAGGRTPRDLLLHPSGRHLVVANQDSDRVVVHALDADGVPAGVVDEQPATTPAGLLCVELAS